MTNYDGHEVPDESESAGIGLTTMELRNRLKHIAGLCYSLACEISNAELEADYLRIENAQLRKRLEQVGIRPPKPATTKHMIKARLGKIESTLAENLKRMKIDT